MNGTWKPPYLLSRQFEGWGEWEEPYAGFFAKHPEVDPENYEGAFALDFTPISVLMPLPLRYAADVQFRAGSPRGIGETVFETQMTISFGEFIEAIFLEVGFHGSPGVRDDALATVLARAQALEGDNDEAK